jgi:predicted type IV restriction endonuclease
LKPLKLPPCSLRIKEGPGGKLIFDRLRQKYVALTPEEWVRQHFVNYLTEYLHYPSGLIQVEASLKLNTMQRRADILIHDRSGQPVMVVECKAPSVKLTQTVLDQVINYNYNYGVTYIILTNGITHLTAKINPDARTFVQLEQIPDYETVISPEP